MKSHYKYVARKKRKETKMFVILVAGVLIGVGFCSAFPGIPNKIHNWFAEQAKKVD